MTVTRKQRQLLAWIARMGEPPHYAPGGMAAAIARLRKRGLIKKEYRVTLLGRQFIPYEDPMDWR